MVFILRGTLTIEKIGFFVFFNFFYFLFLFSWLKHYEAVHEVSSQLDISLFIYDYICHPYLL